MTHYIIIFNVPKNNGVIFWDIEWLCHLNVPKNNTVIFWDIQMTQQFSLHDYCVRVCVCVCVM